MNNRPDKLPPKNKKKCVVCEIVQLANASVRRLWFEFLLRVTKQIVCCELL